MKENRFESGAPNGESTNNTENEALYEDVQSELLSISPKEQHAIEEQAMDFLLESDDLPDQESSESVEVSEQTTKGREFLKERFEAVKDFIGAPLESDDEHVRQEKWQAFRHKLVGAGGILAGASLEATAQYYPEFRQNLEALREYNPNQASMAEAWIHAKATTFVGAGSLIYFLNRSGLRRKLEELKSAKAERSYPYGKGYEG